MFNNQGAGLTDAEVKKLLKFARDRAKAVRKNARLFRDRQMLLDFILIALATGMRPTELLHMKWGDIDGMDLSLREQDVLEDIKIRARGKGKRRRLVPFQGAMMSLSDLYDFWVDDRGRPPTGEDPVFFNKQGQPIKSFSNGLRHLFKAAGLLRDQEDRQRTAYVFRHPLHYDSNP